MFYYGLDRLLLAVLGTPWRAERAFRAGEPLPRPLAPQAAHH